MLKVTSNAAGFNDNTSGRAPTFADVGTSNAFFDFVERGVRHDTIAWWPPAAPTQPYPCSTTAPCFYPSDQALRADAVTNIMLSWLLGNRRPSWTAPPKGQVFASIRTRNSANQSVVTGIQAIQSTPDPPLDPWSYSAPFALGPIGLTDKWNCCFVEAGPEKKCDPFCNKHPFGHAANVNTGWDSFTWDTSVNLGTDSYRYKVVPFGSGQYQSQWCDKGGACRGMASSDSIEPYLLFASTGGETRYWDVALGSVTTSDARKYDGKSWGLYCFDNKLTPWRTRAGMITGVNCGTGGWIATEEGP